MIPMYQFYAYDRPRPRRLDNQQYGVGMPLQEIPTLVPVAQPSRDYYMPWRSLQAGPDGGAMMKVDKDKFHLNLDVQHFSPEEIAVKTVDGFIVVQAKHEEKQDHYGYVSRSFTRRYALPAGIAAELLTSKLSSDGFLTITAPMKAPKTAAERVVPIIQTGPMKKQAEGDDGEKKVESAEKN